ILDEQRRDGEARLLASEARVRDVVVSHAADMSYQGQIHPLRVPIERGWGVERIVSAFREAYRAEYGNDLGDIPTTLVSLRTTVVGTREHVRHRLDRPDERAAPPPASVRLVYFGGWHETPIYRRESVLPGMVLAGPAIVEQADTTTVIEPGMRAFADAYGNLLVEAV
ncbi:MAG: hydantoinase/oxoprolinase family protein, partial [Betaproteobacteria bacterium]|nr:hydantoinase/oxoprolinase family protein [Betaproteobacteria bacterium]